MAIAFDTSVSGGNSASTSLTWSHTVTGSNSVLEVVTQGNVAGTDDITSVTYAGVSLTKIDGVQIPSDRYIGLWELINPATGANNVVISFTGSFMQAHSASYTGVAQSGQPDASNKGTATSTTSVTVSVTTVADNCWLVGSFGNASSTPLAGTGTTSRQAATAGIALFDSNGAKTPPGSFSLQETFGGSTNLAGIVASIAPFVAGASVSNLAVLGVG